ncbi:MAG: phosphate/phosphite/phosphonate ABC transporter substrate-binding protein [Rhodospirillales bacterium]
MPGSGAQRQLIANARMYSVAPGAAAAWKRLFRWLHDKSAVGLTVIDHAYPAPLDELWARSDLACAFMCGWPYMRAGATHRVVAAPVPSAPYAQGRPVYCSHFVVRADAPFRALEDTFGHRFAYTIPDSHSGYNAPRHHLLKYRGRGGRKLYREIVGPLMTPRLMLEAIADGRTDVGPLDSFAYDLLRRHMPELAGRTRAVASTAVAPIPAFMAARGTAPAVVERLAETLCALGDAADQADLRAELCVEGFARVAAGDYRVTEAWAREAETRGLERIA